MSGAQPAPIDVLVQLLHRHRFDYADEKICQLQIEEFLTSAGADFVREAKIAGGFVDFFFPRSGLVLEIKASKNWNAREVYRQCERYCGDDQVMGLVLATGRSQGMPAEIAGKPVRVLQLGAAFL